MSLGNKETLLLVNKADLLNERQRKTWADYFTQENIPFVFFSARVETERNQMMLAKDEEESDSDEQEKGDESEEGSDDLEDGKEKEFSERNDNQEKTEENAKKRKREEPTIAAALNSHRLVGGEELLHLITEKCTEIVTRGARPFVARYNCLAGGDVNHMVVGMVGYPNVGKSSTINALYGVKRVAVSKTPGKTKHFQVK